MKTTKILQLSAWILPLAFVVQVSTAQQNITLKKVATVNVSEIQTDFFPQVIYLDEVPDGHSRQKDQLRQVKRQVAKKYPRKRGQQTDLHLRGPGPQIVQGFPGITGSLGIPLDNHLAVSDNGDVVTVANFHFVVYDANGTLTTAISLIQMTRDLSLPDFRYDPRVIYDRENDRFILAMLHSSDRDRTRIILAFSETDDPNGNWNFYVIEGNPFGINIFSDYPMLGLTDDSFYFTVNAVDVDSTWQAGFVETYIWEFDKTAGYQGENINGTMYNEILYDGKPIRNLCPITTGESEPLEKIYFLSNRNFAVENDTIFLVTLENGEIDVKTLLCDVPYGVPPNAVQTPSLSLQTNDARVLDAFLQDGHVQFVSNCVNPVNGYAAIYHGVIENIESSTEVAGNVVAYGDLELGYPDISYAGTFDGDRRSIIVASHVGDGRFPGISALEYDGGDFSDLVTLHEGMGYIQRIGGEVQRWGDYSGNQRRYNVPGYCWTVSSFGRSNREYGVYITELARSDINVSTRNILDVPHHVYPNPAHSWLDIDFEIPDLYKLSINIYDMNGSLVEQVIEMTPKQTGNATFRITTDDLATGTYLMVAESRTGVLFTERLVIQK